MSVWREVQEALYARFSAAWATTTPYCFDDEPFAPPEAAWARVSVKAAPGDQITLGQPGNRKVDRAGRVFVQLFEPPGKGVGGLSDLAEQAKGIFEGCSFTPHAIRFAIVDIGEESTRDGGRWWGVTVQAPFAYEQLI